MKKSSKKFAALVTLAAFMLTLVPMAAFAAPGDVDAQTSFFYTANKNADNENVEVNTGVEAKFELKDSDNVAATNPGDIIVWATDANGNVSSALQVKYSANGTDPLTDAPANPNIANTVKLAGAKNVSKVELSFKRAGKYTVYAGMGDGTKIADLNKLQSVADQQVIVVKEPTGEVKKLTVNNTDLVNNTETALVPPVVVKANGLEQKELAFVAMDSAGKALANKEIKLSTSSAYAVLDKTTVTTDFLGKATVKYSATRDGEYKIYADVDDFKGIVLAGTKDDAMASTIKTTKTPANPFANKTGVLAKDDIQFEIADANGALVKGLTNASDEPAFDAGKATHKDYVKVVAQPSGTSLNGDAFELVAEGDAYTLKALKELKEGKYTVRVGILTGKTAEVSFEVKKFATAKALKLAFDAETVALGAKAIEPSSVKLVDANGVERAVEIGDDITFGYNGYAVKDFRPAATSFEFNVKDDEKYLGQKIKFTAVSEKLGLVGTAEVIVAQDGQSIKFDSEKGLAGKDNKVVANVVDGAGKTVAVKEDKVVAYVVKASNADAKVNVEVTKTTELATSGKFELKVTSNKDTTAEIAVYVKGLDGKIYANNLNYTFGKEASMANQHVVMTINSKDTIVNNKIVAIDAAPYIKENRTFVPIRALVEDFGAKVEWNGDKQEVTVELEGNKVVMTIGSKDFTFNGEKKTMDVAPEIKADRTFVPVRFVAEAFGFTVTPIYNTDGTTASVVFAK